MPSAARNVPPPWGSARSLAAGSAASTASCSNGRIASQLITHRRSSQRIRRPWHYPIHRLPTITSDLADRTSNEKKNGLPCPFRLSRRSRGQGSAVAVTQPASLREGSCSPRHGALNRHVVLAILDYSSGSPDSASFLILACRFTSSS